MDRLIKPEEYKFIDIPGAEASEYIFRMLEEASSADAAIDDLLDKVGHFYDLSMIVIKEKNAKDQSLKCTYEWDSDGRQKLINLERRFLDNIWDTWNTLFTYNKDGVYIFHRGDYCLFKLIRIEEVESLIQVPLYKGCEFLGCIEFIDCEKRREWSESEIAGMKNMGRIMSSFYFNMRARENVKKELNRILTCDLVTKLPKFDIFRKKVIDSLRSEEGMGGMGLAIICSDITNFKFINEKYGYTVGDTLLRCFAERIYSNMNRIVACCREYSDNFIIAVKFPLEETDDSIRFHNDRCNISFIREAREKIFDSNLVINSGIYFMCDGRYDVDSAISNANLARKYAKELTTINGSRSVIFKESMTDEIRRCMDLVLRMEPALSEGEFKIFLQPKVVCETMQIIGAEALIRWQGSDGRFIFPDEFIPAFEREGCIVKMDYFVYRSVFKYIKERLDNNQRVVPVSMNVSRVHLFNTAFIKYVEQLLEEFRVPVEYLEFELTENIYIDDLPMVLYTLEKLRNHGIKISIDDFGSGYSSLDILTSLPIDILKLDKVFMKNELDSNDKIIISCLIDMARKLGMRVLCEGVENEQQRQFLIDACCDEMQGYYFSRPICIEDFNKLLEEEQM